MSIFSPIACPQNRAPHPDPAGCSPPSSPPGRPHGSSRGSCQPPHFLPLAEPQLLPERAAPPQLPANPAAPHLHRCGRHHFCPDLSSQFSKPPPVTAAASHCSWGDGPAVARRAASKRHSPNKALPHGLPDVLAGFSPTSHTCLLPLPPCDPGEGCCRRLSTRPASPPPSNPWPDVSLLVRSSRTPVFKTAIGFPQIFATHTPAPLSFSSRHS